MDIGKQLSQVHAVLLVIISAQSVAEGLCSPGSGTHKKTVAEATVLSYETKPLGDSIVSYATLTEMHSDQNSENPSV